MGTPVAFAGVSAAGGLFYKAKAAAMTTTTICRGPTCYTVLERASGAIAIAATERVDTKSRVIRGVKVLGIESRNTGRVLGLDEAEFGNAVDRPYAYSMEALRRAAKLYEGAPVFSNHLEFGYGDDGQRFIKADGHKNEDLLGWLQNVRVVEGQGLFADLHYLQTHPMAARMVEIARRKPDKLALSHEAEFANPQLRNGRIELTEITNVQAVALVSSAPGTTNGLFETTTRKPKRKARPIMTAIQKYKRPGSIAEAFRGISAPIATESHLGDMCREILSTRKMSEADLAGLLGTDTDSLHKIMAGEMEPSGDGVRKMAEMLGMTVQELMDGQPMPDDLTVPDEAEDELTECMDTLQECGIRPTPTLIEAMVALPRAKRRKYAEALRSIVAAETIPYAPTARSESPRPQPRQRPAHESAAGRYAQPGSIAEAMRTPGNIMPAMPGWNPLFG